MKIDLTNRGERPEHGAHDQLLVARFAAGDVTDAEADAARSLVASCADCRLLASDLLAIAQATADLPNPVRRRDFRLTRERAAELRRPAAISRLSRVIDGGEASRRLVPLQRFAVAAVAIGLVMAVVSSPAGIPGFSTGSAASKTAGQTSERGATVPAPGLAAAPNSAAPASAVAFPARAYQATAGAGLVGASPGTVGVQKPLMAPSAAAQLVGAAPAPPAGRQAPSAPAEPALAAAPSSAAQMPSPAAAPSAGRAIGSSARTSQSSTLTALAPPPSTLSGTTGQAGSQGQVTANSQRFGPWQAWLLIAAAGLLVLVVVHLRVRLAA
ncbi:MAG: hypothetical protein ACLQBX_11435 [Candidatus Limnocylindrales bacterium]